jgi:hypothetical protein
MSHDDYAQQMAAAADRESLRTAAEGNCIVRAKDGSLCRRRVAKELLAKGIQKCRLHLSQLTRSPASARPG